MTGSAPGCVRCAWWQGNRLAGEGLSGMCTGLARNKSLTYLCLADNLINNVGGPMIRPVALPSRAILQNYPVILWPTGACRPRSAAHLLHGHDGLRDPGPHRPALQSNRGGGRHHPRPRSHTGKTRRRLSSSSCPY